MAHAHKEDITLVNQHCIPCNGNIRALEVAEAKNMLLETPDWELEQTGHAIHRSFSFKNFAKAFALVEKVSALAEKEAHHPDFCFGWGYVSISLTTHAIKGLHHNDFIMAAKINDLYSNLS